MNVDELMGLDRDLTDEEFLFLEQELLKTAQQLCDGMDELVASVAEQDPHLAAQIRRSADATLANIKEGIRIPLQPKPN